MFQVIHPGKTRIVTVQPNTDGVDNNNGESLIALENGSSFLEVTPIQVATAPFTFSVKALDFVGQNALVKYKFDGRLGEGDVEVLGEVQFSIAAPDANGSTATVGTEF